MTRIVEMTHRPDLLNDAAASSRYRRVARVYFSLRAIVFWWRERLPSADFTAFPSAGVSGIAPRRLLGEHLPQRAFIPYRMCPKSSTHQLSDAAGTASRNLIEEATVCRRGGVRSLIVSVASSAERGELSRIADPTGDAVVLEEVRRHWSVYRLQRMKLIDTTGRPLSHGPAIVVTGRQACCGFLPNPE